VKRSIKELQNCYRAKKHYADMGTISIPPYNEHVILTLQFNDPGYIRTDYTLKNPFFLVPILRPRSIRQRHISYGHHFIPILNIWYVVKVNGKTISVTACEGPQMDGKYCDMFD
jgi:hypothetical protein